MAFNTIKEVGIIQTADPSKEIRVSVVEVTSRDGSARIQLDVRVWDTGFSGRYAGPTKQGLLVGGEVGDDFAETVADGIIELQAALVAKPTAKPVQARPVGRVDTSKPAGTRAKARRPRKVS